MSWIQTYSGAKFDVFDPRAENIHLIDIAVSLGNMCRYNGHCKKFYSVAEHSVLMAKAFASDDSFKDSRLPLHALMHDAAEAYVSDVPRPIKDQLTGFREIEQRVLEIIYEALGVALPSALDLDVIKIADLRMVVTEREQIVEQSFPWQLTKGYIAYPNMILPCWSPKDAGNHWLEWMMEQGIS